MQVSFSGSRDKKQYYLHPTLISRATSLVVDTLLPVFSTVRVRGLEHVPVDGAVVLVSNHVSFLDASVLDWVMPRRVHFMGKAELFNNPLLDTLLRHNGSFPVKREVLDSWAMQHALHILENGKMLGLFPEGGVSREHTLQRGKIGAALLARRVGCPIVPIAITGSFRLFREMLRRTQITVRIGAPLYSQPADSVQNLTDLTMHTIAEMLPLSYRGIYEVKLS